VTGCGGGGGGSTAQRAPPLSVTAESLYSFGGTSTDAINPSGLLIQGTDGNFYGTTQLGGLALCPTNSNPNGSCGTVYKITPTGEETVLHSFTGAPADGDLPNVLIQGSDGDFYGTTGSGGANNRGTVFSDGNFYGTASGGGANQGGTAFQVTPAGVFTVLYSFPNTSDNSGLPGAEPETNLVQGSDGNFYGTTYQNGAYNLGYFFKLIVQ
jgi:uncharacterized repeat protein (TIGR03803 family)